MIDKKFITGALVVLTLAVVVLTGMAIVDVFGDTLKDSTLVSDETITAVNGTAVSLAYDEVDDSKSLSVYNSTDSSKTLTEDTDFTINYESGTLTLLDAGIAYNNEDVNVTYYYLADTTSSQTAENFNTGLGYFATFIGILVISIVGKGIIRLFTKAD